ncbi:phage major capsid protein [Parabacteroides goldsteinii]|uniref:phage major capsid protein n=1 Tax=Parabacteroides goldsteinii TaxID=328812 RepID=UPI002166AF21|nr:phage major capsid protein [Parabacteroides goldsteinii]MCS2426116.1 phage major capsid protein [Parabacteroides goldsteinii]
MDTLTLIDQKEQLRKKAEALIAGAEKELRKLNEGETLELNHLKEEIANIDSQIKQIEEETKRNYKPQIKNKTMEKFSLLKAINDVANNRQLDERAQEIVSTGVAEMRKAGLSCGGQIVLPIEERADIQATVATAGQENVAEDKLGILEPLRANLVLVQAGASYMTGLIGNVSIPAYSGSNVTWAGEVTEATEGVGTFSEVNLEPKRLTAKIDVSKQFLMQDSNSAEEMLKRDIVAAISNKLEATILGAGAGSATEPKGLLNGVTADTAAITYKDIVAMEAELEDANVRGDIKYIVSPSAKADLKTTDKGTDTGKYLMEGNEVNGYPVLCTSAVADKGVVMGNFSDYVIGQWGGIDLTIDPYTQAAKGKVRLVINAYFDAKPRREEAFVTKVLKA